MKPIITDPRFDLYHGGALEVLRSIWDGCAHTCVTSPPYWGLRKYEGVAPSVWADGWTGCLGNEPTPDLYVSHIVTIFREVRRVLRDDGTFWCNIGDSYSGSGRGPTGENGIGDQGERQGFADPGASRGGPWNLKPKDLCLVPERLAIALQDDGWWVRSRIAWVKKSCMPESVTDRPTNSWEHIWMLTKSDRYFYDSDAVRQQDAGITGGRQRAAIANDPRYASTDFKDYHDGRTQRMNGTVYTGTAQLRSAWILGPEPLADAHYASFPSEIPRRAIRAGSSERGACGKCGAPWARVVERVRFGKAASATKFDSSCQGGPLAHSRQAYRAAGTEGPPAPRTIGWRATCSCDASDPVPCVVLDPFVGSGTSGVVAMEEGRRFIGIDASATYLRDIAAPRLAATVKGITVAEERNGQAVLF